MFPLTKVQFWYRFLEPLPYLNRILRILRNLQGSLYFPLKPHLKGPSPISWAKQVVCKATAKGNVGSPDLSFLHRRVVRFIACSSETGAGVPPPPPKSKSSVCFLASSRTFGCDASRMSRAPLTLCPPAAASPSSFHGPGRTEVM